MAYLYCRENGRAEIREAHSTPRGPRSRTLASFRHPNLVRVARFFEAHATAYMVLEYERGSPSFRAAVAAGARMVMTGHLALPGGRDLPASLSTAVLRDLLRGQLGFAGVTVTDALDMRALAQGSAQARRDTSQAQR